jgi:magnesium transporter
VLAVALAIFAACAMASFVAMGLPWVLHRLGMDPAFPSLPMWMRHLPANSLV